MNSLVENIHVVLYHMQWWLERWYYELVDNVHSVAGQSSFLLDLSNPALQRRQITSLLCHPGFLSLGCGNNIISFRNIYTLTFMSILNLFTVSITIITNIATIITEYDAFTKLRCIINDVLKCIVMIIMARNH